MAEADSYPFFTGDLSSVQKHGSTIIGPVDF